MILDELADFIDGIDAFNDYNVSIETMPATPNQIINLRLAAGVNYYPQAEKWTTQLLEVQMRGDVGGGAGLESDAKVLKERLAEFKSAEVRSVIINEPPFAATLSGDKRPRIIMRANVSHITIN